MDNVKRVLREVGLAENEIIVYMATVNKKNLTPTDISSITGIPRSTIYSIAMSLALKGLIKMHSSDGMLKQQTLISGRNPSFLRKYIRNQRSRLTKLEVDIVDILPQLKGIFHENKTNSNFEFYPGIDGVKKIYSHSDEYDSIDLDKYAWDHMVPTDIFGQKNLNRDLSKYSKIHSKNKSMDYELFPLNNWTKHVLTYQTERDPRYLEKVEFRYIEGSFFELFLRLVIKGDHVFMACANNDEMWGVKIRSYALAKSLKSIFLLNWQIATPVTKDLVKSWGPNEFLEEQKKKGKN